MSSRRACLTRSAGSYRLGTGTRVFLKDFACLGIGALAFPLVPLVLRFALLLPICKYLSECFRMLLLQF